MTEADLNTLRAVRDEMQTQIRWNGSYRSEPVQLSLVEKWAQQLAAVLVEARDGDRPRPQA